MVHPGAVAPDVARKQDQVDQGEDVVDGVVMLGDPECPADHCSWRGRKRVSQLADGVGRHARFPFGVVERV